MTGIVDRLILYVQQFEDQHAPQTMTILLREAADEIERLRAEVNTWVDKTKTAVWSDSEQCKLLAADNDRLRADSQKAALDYLGQIGQLSDETERLRAALEEIATKRCDPVAVAVAALEEKHD